MKRQVKLVVQAFKLILKKPRYIFLAVVVALAFFFFNLWLANYSLLKYIFTAGIFDLKIKALMLLNPLPLISASFTLRSLIFTLALSVLFGLNFTFFVYFLKKRIAIQKSVGVSIFGIIFGFLGIGCTACGSVVLSAIFGFATASSLLGALPFGGLEFQILGVLALFFSIYLIAKKLQDPIVCKKL